MLLKTSRLEKNNINIYNLIKIFIKNLIWTVYQSFNTMNAVRNLFFLAFLQALNSSMSMIIQAIKRNQTFKFIIYLLIKYHQSMKWSNGDFLPYGKMLKTKNNQNHKKNQKVWCLHVLNGYWVTKMQELWIDIPFWKQIDFYNFSLTP